VRISLSVFVLCIGFGSQGITQTLTSEQREKILLDLQSDRFATLLEASIDVAEHEITEAIPILEQRFWSVDPLLHVWFLRALWKTESPNTLALARAFIDSVDNYKSRGVPIDPLSEKVDVVEILFDYGDYSGTPFVFELLERNPTIYPSGALLRRIVESVPEYSERAGQEMTRLSREGMTSLSRGHALRDLIQLYGLGVSDLILHMATMDTVETNRWYAINMLRKLGHPQIKSFLYDRLFNEPYAGYRRFIADTLLKRYGTPEDYHKVQEYVQFEPDTLRKSLASRALERFTPPVPPSSTPPLVMLDSLISYKHQCHTLGWILNEGILTSLDQKLDAARKAIVNDRPSAKQILQAFVNEVEALNNQGNQITREAYVFLRYHALYIIERL
jgi:hypothetical protein